MHVTPSTIKSRKFDPQSFNSFPGFAFIVLLHIHLSSCRSLQLVLDRNWGSQLERTLVLKGSRFVDLRSCSLPEILHFSSSSTLLFSCTSQCSMKYFDRVQRSLPGLSSNLTSLKTLTIFAYTLAVLHSPFADKYPFKRTMVPSTLLSLFLSSHGVSTSLRHLVLYRLLHPKSEPGQALRRQLSVLSPGVERDLSGSQHISYWRQTDLEMPSHHEVR